MKRENIFLIICAVLGGFLNGLFGSGAGIVCVMLLRLVIGDDRKAHATSTLVVLIMSAASLVLYALFGDADIKSALLFVPGGVLGAVAGAMWLNKIDSDRLRRLFGGIIAASGVVMLLS